MKLKKYLYEHEIGWVFFIFNVPFLKMLLTGNPTGIIFLYWCSKRDV